MIFYNIERIGMLHESIVEGTCLKEHLFNFEIKGVPMAVRVFCEPADDRMDHDFVITLTTIVEESIFFYMMDSTEFEAIGFAGSADPDSPDNHMNIMIEVLLQLMDRHAETAVSLPNELLSLFQELIVANSANF